MEWEEGAAASFQSRTWPQSSSAERSLALGEEERVESPLRPFNGSHSSDGGRAVWRQRLVNIRLQSNIIRDAINTAKKVHTGGFVYFSALKGHYMSHLVWRMIFGIAGSHLSLSFSSHQAEILNLLHFSDNWSPFLCQSFIIQTCHAATRRNHSLPLIMCPGTR